MGRRVSGAVCVRLRQVVGAVAVGSFLGCAGVQPQLSHGSDRDDYYGRSDRDDRHGRYGRDRAPQGPVDIEGLLGLLGVLAGLAAACGIGHLVSRAASGSTSSQGEVGTSKTPTGDCTLPATSVQVCLSSRGYRFAIPSPGTCAPGSSPLHTVALTCADLDRPAHHACLDRFDGWWAVRSWESCASRGYRDAPGDFVPPGRLPSEGLSPRAMFTR